MAEGGRPAKGPWGQTSLPQRPGTYVPSLASSQKRREVTAISPMSGEGQGSTSLTYQSLK